MAVLGVKLDNILCFDDFEADFSYPKKLVNSPLNCEYLSKFPNIRYKKVNIIIGSNGTGKTSLGKAIWKTLNFIKSKEAEPIKQLVADKTRNASILLDYVFASGLFFRFEVLIKPNQDVFARYRSIKLEKTDTYSNAIDKLPKDVKFENYINALRNVKNTGWHVRFPSNEDGFDKIFCKYEDEEKQAFAEIYEKIIKAFDESIEKVFVSTELPDTFVVQFYNGDRVAVTNGQKLSALERLSSGTKNVVNIAGLIYSIKNHINGFYYADEQFSYVNSDLEIACLATMIDCLGDGEQLFFTSHNEEIMNISLPLHSFSFLRKIKTNSKYTVELINAASFEKRNNVTVKNLYDNDYFDLAPDTSKVFEVAS